MRPGSSSISRSGMSASRSGMSTAYGTTYGHRPASVSAATSVSLRSRATRGTTATAGRQAAYLSHDVTIANRPVTAAGGIAMSMSTSAASTRSSSGGNGNGNGSSTFRGNRNVRSPIRKVRDASYYIGLLRSKESAIGEEIYRLKDKTRFLEKERISSNEKRVAFDTLSTDIQGLEQTLADFNNARDRQHQRVDVDELESTLMERKQDNQIKAEQVDALFLAHRDVKKEIFQVEESIQDIYDTIQTVLKNTDDNAVEEYNRLTTELKELKIEGKRAEEEVTQLRLKHSKLQAIAHQRPDRLIQEHYNSEQNRVTTLKESLARIKEELNLARMTPDEAKAHLLAQVKSDKAKMKELDEEFQQLDEELRRNEELEREILMELEEKKRATSGTISNNDRSTKTFHDDKIQQTKQYLASSENIISKLQKEVEAKQATIKKLNEDIAQLETCKSNLPSREQFKALADDAAFKEKHLENSEMTMKHLRKQKEKRVAELIKINSLEEKILKEEEQLTSQLTQMKEDTKKYEDLESVEDRAEVMKDYLSQMQERYSVRTTFLKDETKILSDDYEDMKKSLDGNDAWQGLLLMEEKIQRQGELIFSLKEFITIKRRQTSYEKIRDNCLQIVNGATKSHIQLQ